MSNLHKVIHLAHGSRGFHIFKALPKLVAKIGNAYLKWTFSEAAVDFPAEFLSKISVEHVLDIMIEEVYQMASLISRESWTNCSTQRAIALNREGLIG